MTSGPRPRTARSAVALAASLVALCLPAALASSASAAPAPTNLTLAGSAAAPRYGDQVTLTATLGAGGAPVAGREVALYRSGALVAKQGTDAAGKSSFRFRAQQSGSYDARFAPTAAQDVAAYQPATSAPLVLTVRPVVRVSVKSPLRARHKVVGVPHERVRIRGALSPALAGQEVVIRVSRRRHQVRRKKVRVRARGRFSVWFTPRRRGSYSIRAGYAKTDVLGPANAAPKHLLVVRASAHQGSRGPAVRALQRRLADLGYLTPVSGSFDATTGRAVLAFRKVNGLSRTMSAGRPVFRKLARGGGAFHLRHRRAGKHVEFDWSRQVVVLARGSRPIYTLHASSGKPSTPTVFGKFHFYGKSPGFNSHGMYYSNYFIGGYAIHGYESVPTYAASHGCIRIPIPSAIRVYRWIDVGDPIYVYR
jgi:hypothetical protein